MLALTMEERIRRFEQYQHTRTPEDIRIEALEAEDDERFLEQLDPNEPLLPIEDLWNAWGLEDRLTGPLYGGLSSARRLGKHDNN